MYIIIPIILYLIVFLHFVAIYHTKLVIVFLVLKLFDILGPPSFLKRLLQKRMDTWVGANTNCNKMKREPNAIYLIFPHGATFFPAFQLPTLLNMNNEYPIICINKWFLLIPGFIGFTKCFSGFISTEKGNLKMAVRQNARPLIIYPGGSKEVLFNSKYKDPIYILDIRKKLLVHLLAAKRPIHIVTVKNESECYFFNHYIAIFYRFINNFIDMGIPFPYPQCSGKKLQLHISEAIETENIKSISRLKNLIYERVEAPLHT